MGGREGEGYTVSIKYKVQEECYLQYYKGACSRAITREGTCGYVPESFQNNQIMIPGYPRVCARVCTLQNGPASAAAAQLPPSRPRRVRPGAKTKAGSSTSSTTAILTTPHNKHQRDSGTRGRWTSASTRLSCAIPQLLRGLYDKMVRIPLGFVHNLTPVVATKNSGFRLD